MSQNTKNIIIVAVVAIALGFAYFYFFKPVPEQASLTTTTDTTTTGTTTAVGGVSTTVPESEFLAVLLNVTNIKLDDSIFADPAFTSLHDSSIELVSDIPEGRPNPFAPIGSDVVATPASTITPDTITPPVTSTNTTNPSATPKPKP